MKFQQKTYQLINDATKIKKINNYVKLLEDNNKHFNLTGFKDDQLWSEGIYQSLISLSNITSKEGVKVLDVGAGAGFPSLPFKIVHPEIDLYIFEPIQKRVNFLQLVCDTLHLHCNITKIRAESSKHRDFFDYICARAVAPLHILIEITHHLGKIGAHFIFIKGPNYQEEIDKSQPIIKALNINLKIEKMMINNKQIVIITYQKTIKTPKKYPRQWKDIVFSKKM